MIGCDNCGTAQFISSARRRCSCLAVYRCLLPFEGDNFLSRSVLLQINFKTHGLCSYDQKYPTQRSVNIPCDSGLERTVIEHQQGERILLNDLRNQYFGTLMVVRYGPSFAPAAAVTWIVLSLCSEDPWRCERCLVARRQVKNPCSPTVIQK